MKSLFVQYTYLQGLDLLTTMAFLNGGLNEANPLVARLMEMASSPLSALLFVKACAILLGLYCWRERRRTTLVRANALYAVLVAWNLLCLIVGLGSHGVVRA
jgi:hypothetical protein